MEEKMSKETLILAQRGRTGHDVKMKRKSENTATIGRVESDERWVWCSRHPLFCVVLVLHGV